MNALVAVADIGEVMATAKRRNRRHWNGSRRTVMRQYSSYDSKKARNKRNMSLNQNTTIAVRDDHFS